MAFSLGSSVVTTGDDETAHVNEGCRVISKNPSLVWAGKEKGHGRDLIQVFQLAIIFLQCVVLLNVAFHFKRETDGRAHFCSSRTREP